MSILLSDSFFQTYLARTAAAYFSDEWGLPVRIESLQVTAYPSVRIKGFSVTDHQEKNLASFDELNVRLKTLDLAAGNIHFSKVYGKNVDFDLIKYLGEEELNLSQITNHFRKDTIDEEEKPSSPLQLKCDQLVLEDSHFHYQNENNPREKIGMHYSDINVLQINTRITNIHIDQDTFNFVIERMSCHDTSGFRINSLEGDFRLSDRFLIGNGMKVKTPQSDLDLDLRFDYDRWEAYKEFLDEVYITGEIRDSRMNLAQIGYFADVMFDMKDSIAFSGKVAGPVSKFRADDFYFKFGKVTEFKGNLSMNGLPDIYETFINANITHFYTNKEDVESFAIPIEGLYIELPDQLARFGDLNISGYFTGFYNDFVAQAGFKTGLGDVKTDIILKTVQPNDEIQYNGEVKATNFNLGKFINAEKYIGELNLDAKINGIGITEETFSLSLDGQVDSLDFLTNEFNGVQVSGKLQSDKFDGSVNVNDKNLGLDFLGKVDFSGNEPEFDFRAGIKEANLYALGLTQRDTITSFSSNLNISFFGDQLDDIEGYATIDSTSYTEGDKNYTLDHFSLITIKDTLKFKRIILNSDILDARVQGNFYFRDLVTSFKEFANKSVVFFDEKEMKEGLEDQDFQFSVDLKNTKALTQLFIPTLDVANNTKLSGGYDSSKGMANFLLKSDTISVSGVKLKDVQVNGFGYDQQMDLITRVSRIAVKEPTENDSLTIGLDSLFFQVRAENDTLDYYLAWSDTSTVIKNLAKVQGFFHYQLHDTNTFKVEQSNLLIRGKSWKFLENNQITWRRNYFDFEDFGLKSGKQNMTLNGVYSSAPGDTLNLGFEGWDISNFDPLTLGYGVNLDGHLSGDMKIFQRDHVPEFFGDLAVDTLTFNGVRLGRFDVTSNYNPKNKNVEVKSEIITSGGGKMFDLSGAYYSQNVENSLRFKAMLNNMSLVVVNPFLKGLASEVEGLASGEIEIVGNGSKPQLLGDIKFQRTQFRVDYLNVPYSLSGRAKLVPGRINLEDIILYDTLSNQGRLNGYIGHRYLRDWNFNVGINMQNMAAFNTTFEQNEVFYGKARASGFVGIKGPLDRIALSVKAKSEKGTSVTIPLNTAADISENRNIIFINNSDSLKVTRKAIQNSSGFSLDLDLLITPDASVQIDLPLNTGSIMATGDGNIQLGLSPSGEFSIVGDYTIQNGIFNFRLENLLYRKFKILKGGRISWTGSPYDANVNFTAEYDLKASLSGLGIELDNANQNVSRRAQVNCYLGLKNDLFDPDLHFSISLPNLDERTQQYVYSVIDTTNQTVMQQQMFSLLLLGSFSYSNPTVGIGSSSLNLISSQLSSWLSQLSNDFDIGINYRPGDQLTSQELEVALSTQLFDDRVSIDGNIGVSDNRTTQNTSSIVGDVNVEVKLTADGRFRVKAFNRSNDNTLYSLSPYDGVSSNTQGIGFFYTKEFDSFRELFGGKKKSERKKKEKKRRNKEAVLKEE